LKVAQKHIPRLWAYPPLSSAWHRSACPGPFPPVQASLAPILHP
jgi:hypothetical protein